MQSYTQVGLVDLDFGDTACQLVEIEQILEPDHSMQKNISERVANVQMQLVWLCIMVQLENWMFISRDVLDCQDFEEKILVILLKFKILKKKIFSRLNEILQTDSLLESQTFEYIYI